MGENVRASWDEYFMAIARQVATRSTCDRKHVGAVVVKDRMILTTGYNGSIRGLPHCDDVGHLMEDGHCVRTTHAEANALVQAARKRSGKSMSEKLAFELVDAMNGLGAAVKRREDTHKMADANRAFSHFRW